MNNTETLVKRLREEFRGCPFPSVYFTMQEAADRIVFLEAALKAATEKRLTP
jgi:hypothetical protein